MSILYEDSYLVCNDNAITIHWYYFPVGSKRIPYSKIKKIQEFPMDFWSGGARIWGMGLSPHWFHLDINRPWKKKCIIIDEGEWIKSVITPDDPEKVRQILQAHGKY